jgi:hypothetical protein
MTISKNIKDREWGKFRDKNDEVVVATCDESALSNKALLDLMFWRAIGIDARNFNFVITNSCEPILNNEGKFVVIE